MTRQQTVDGLEAISGALRLSGHVLGRDPGQLPSQLTGRLLDVSMPQAQRLVEKAKTAQGPWLRPLRASLGSPLDPLRGIFSGHQGDVTCLVVDHAGRRLVSGSGDGTVRIWDLATAAEVLVLAGHRKSVTGVATSPDGTTCYSVSLDGSLRVWSMETGECLGGVEAHEGGGSACGAHPDGSRVVTGGDDGLVKVWDAWRGTKLGQSSVGSPVRVIEMWPNGSGIVIGCRNGAVLMWDGADSEPTAIRQGQAGVRPGVPFDGYIGDIAVSPSGRAVAVVVGKDTVHLDDLQSRSRLELNSRTHCVAITPDGRSLVTCPTDRRVLELWSMETGEFEGCVGEGTGEVLAIAITPDGRHALTATFDGLIKQWSLAEPVEGWPEAVMPIAGTARPDLTDVVTGSENGEIELWDAVACSRRAVIHGHEGPIYSVAVTVDGTMLSTGSADQTARIWDLPSGTELNRMDHNTTVVDCSWTAAGDRFISGAVDGVVRVWRMPTCSLEGVYDVGAHNLTQALLSPDGAWVVAVAAGVGSGNSATAVWRHTANAAAAQPEGIEQAVAVFSYGGPHCLFAPSGRHMAMGSADGIIRVWRTDDWVEIASWKAHDGAITSIAFTPDASRIVSGSGYDEALVRTWDLDGRPVAEFAGHAQSTPSRAGSAQLVVRGVRDLAVTPDGRQVVSCSADRTVRIWETDSGRQVGVFSGDSGAGWCGLADHGRVIVAGETRGALHFLAMPGVPNQP